MAQVQGKTLLDQVQALVELERSLTDAIEKAKPWLPDGRGRARPLPTDMKGVENVLSLARNLASRTSAPAGWNPQAPVIGFTTPNPMPHQLRGGSLGGLQLEMARKHQQEFKKEQMEKKREREEAKKKEENQTQSIAKRPAVGQRQNSATAAAKQQQRPRQPVMVADMNLSDSSSEEEESDEED